MKYLLKLLLCLLCFTSWTGCSKDDEPDLGNLSLPADYLSQTIWKGHFEPAISDDPEKSEITITFFSELGGTYLLGDEDESQSTAFLYNLKGRVINIRESDNDELDGFWWIISISEKEMILSNNPETPSTQTKIILTKVL